MAEGRSSALWAHTSSVLTLIANVNRDPRKKPSPFEPSDFSPHPKRPELPLPKIKLASVKDLLMGKR